MWTNVNSPGPELFLTDRSLVPRSVSQPHMEDGHPNEKKTENLEKHDKSELSLKILELFNTVFRDSEVVAAGNHI